METVFFLHKGQTKIDAPQCNFRGDDELFGEDGSYLGSMRSSKSSGSSRSRGRAYSLMGGVTAQELYSFTNVQLDLRLNTLVCIQQSTIANAGNGLFFTQNIPKDTILGYYKGRGYLDNTPEEKERNNQLNQNYIVVTNFLRDQYVIDASDLATSNALRYANDPRDIARVNIMILLPRKRLTGVEVNTVQEVGYPRAYVITTRDVFIGEEAFVDYGQDWWDGYAKEQQDALLAAIIRAPTPEPKKRSKKRSKKRQSPQALEIEEDQGLPRSIKTKGFHHIPTYAFRKTVPEGCPDGTTWENLCTQDNMYIVKEKVRETAAERQEREFRKEAPQMQCKCLVYQNGDPTECSDRPKGAGCNLPDPRDGDETRIRNSNGEPYYTYAKDLRMTFIELQRDGKPTVPACGCYKDDIHKDQMRLRKQRQRERDREDPERRKLPKYGRGGGKKGQQEQQDQYQGWGDVFGRD